jgi:hypothetical protein
MSVKEILISVACVTLIFSCSKKDDTAIINKNLVGTWRFVSMDEGRTDTWNDVDDTRIISDSSISVKTTGTFEFTTDSLFSENFSYEIATITHSWNYQLNGQLYDSSYATNNYTYTPTNSRSIYTKIADDSIYVGVTKNSNTNGSYTEGARDFKISWIKDTLVMTYRYDYTGGLFHNNIPITINHTGYLIRKLVRK